jgi:periplasmic protein TonB
VGERLKPSAAEVKWQRALLLHLNRHKRYPVEARSRHVQGVTQVEFQSRRIQEGSRVRQRP